MILSVRLLASLKRPPPACADLRCFVDAVWVDFGFFGVCFVVGYVGASEGELLA